MSTTKATRRGSQRARAPETPGGWAKVTASALAAYMDIAPRPVPRCGMLVDLDCMADERGRTGGPLPSLRDLAARWGVGVKAARLALADWREASPVGRSFGVGHSEGHTQGHTQGHGLSATMPMDSTAAPLEGHTQGHTQGHSEGHSAPLEAAGDGLRSEPPDCRLQTADSLLVESPSAPADAPAEPGPSRAEARRASLEALWAEFQTMRKAADPAARNVGLDVHLKALERCLKALQPLAREHNCKPGEALLVGWWTFWHGADDFWRTKRAGVLAVQSYLRPDNCGRLAQVGLDAMAAARDAQTPPTADAVLDALLAEGQDRAEARMPAWASTLRWTVARMGGDVAAMRTARSPERMRAAWATAWGEALARPRVATSADAAPPLALVAR